jgi:hypothetical protein
MPQLDERLNELLRAIRDRLPRRDPDWTDPNDRDPGTTLLALFAQLADDLLQRAARLPEAGRAELARLGLRLAELDRSDDPVEVRVNGERWQRVAKLGEADADAPVFELDPDRGAVRFGDGRHGRRPPNGARVTVRYKEGGGASGTDITLSTTWPFPTSSRTVSSRGDSICLEQPAPPAPAPDVERVAFFSGRMLTAEDLVAEQDYGREKLRRLTRAALGTGIVSGLTPTISTNDSGAPTLTISPGYAVDPAGELIVVPGTQTIDLDPTSSGSVIQLLFDERPARFVASEDESASKAEPRPTRIVEGFSITLSKERDSRAVVLGTVMHEPDGWHVRDGGE